MLPPYAIYVHVPYCEQKCTYCDFFTITDSTRSHPDAPRWLELCLRELDLWHRHHPDLAHRHVSSVFFGGGTPSLLPPQQFASFLESLRAQFRLAPDAEVTLETQPGTLDALGLRQFREAGINRFSVGVQTFNGTHLAATARRHTADDSRNTLAWAAESGAVVGADLIFALPTQTLEQWDADLQEALSFPIAHLSTYELTYHEETTWHRHVQQGRITPADDELRLLMYRQARHRAAGAGLKQYEVSNFARPGAESQHNRAYWELRDFIGLGAGAHSGLDLRRYANPRSAPLYSSAIDADQLPAVSTDTDDPQIMLLENLQMALRLVDGVDIPAFNRRCGCDLLGLFGARLEALQQEGLIHLTPSRITLTETGLERSDGVIEYLL
jgi:oxygen-independent coproporphyrinogen-3 oxidase